jgi:hypothetical protein
MFDMKIFIGPHEVAGFYANLELGLRSLGVDAEFVEYRPHKFGYRITQRAMWLIGLMHRLNGRRGQAERHILWRVLFALPGELLRWPYFFYALARYDVFVFGFGQSILPGNLDLPLLRLFGKTIISHLGHGSELRPPFMDGSYQSPDGSMQPSLQSLLKISVRIRRRARKFERYANVVIGAPFSSTQYAQKRMVNVFALGIPSRGVSSMSPEAGQIGLRERSGMGHLAPVRILHCPSHPAVKGSGQVRALIQNLRAKGHAIDYREISGRPNAEVLDAIAACDFVIDQMFSDSPLPGFATEAAWYGKAVVIGGYGFELLKQHVPPSMWPPSRTCHPDDMESVVESLILDPLERHRIGQALQHFVRTHWAAEAVASRFVRLMNGQIPSEWWLNPGDVVYVHGVGQTEAQTQARIRSLVELAGIDSLQLSAHTSVEEAALAFAQLERQGA